SLKWLADDLMEHLPSNLKEEIQQFSSEIFNSLPGLRNIDVHRQLVSRNSANFTQNFSVPETSGWNFKYVAEKLVQFRKPAFIPSADKATSTCDLATWCQPLSTAIFQEIDNVARSRQL